MINAMRSELTRSRRPGVLIAWFGLTALFATMIVTVIFQIVSDGNISGPASGPGVQFPTIDTLESAQGITAPLSSASSMFGVVTLSFWAVLTAGDHSSGLVRLLVSAQPRRWKLLAGKIAALSVWTAVATTIAVGFSVLASAALGARSKLDVSAWGTDLPQVLASAWLSLFLSLLVWGCIGLVLATVTRSSAIAVSLGVGWILVVESVIGAAAQDARDWMPGSTISALAAGGTSTIEYDTAAILGSIYLVVALGVATVVFTRRDITN